MESEFRIMSLLQRGQIPLEECFVIPSVSKASSANTQVFHQSEVLHLVTDDIFTEQGRSLVIVRFDASDVRWFF